MDVNGPSSSRPRLARLIGVYNAKGTVLGELAYAVGRLVGTSNCALCEITHGRLRGRSDWNACRDSLGVPFVTFHRDDQPPEVRAASGDTTPVVVAQMDDGEVVVLLGGVELESCERSPARLMDLIRVRLRATGGLGC